MRRQHGASTMILHGQFEKNKLFIKEVGVQYWTTKNTRRPPNLGAQNALEK
jgi:hypothetical protein